MHAHPLSSPFSVGLFGGISDENLPIYSTCNTSTLMHSWPLGGFPRVPPSRYETMKVVHCFSFRFT